MTMRMGARLRAGVATAALALALGGAAGAAQLATPVSAWAETAASASEGSATVQTVTVQPTYQNPSTGKIEDSGGASNRALGESMVVSTTDASGLLETTASGRTFLMLRFHLADQVQGLSAEVSSDGGATFVAAEVEQVQEDTSHGEASQDNTVDYRFEVPGVDAVVRLGLDVIPMGRVVTYFVTVGDAVAGNSAGFVEGGGAVAAAAAEGTDAQSSVDADKYTASDSADSDTESSLNEESGSSAEGISEFDADGHAVDGDAAQPLSAGALAAIAGGAAVVALVAFGVFYFVRLKPRRAREAAAAAAAAGNDGSAGEDR